MDGVIPLKLQRARGRLGLHLHGSKIERLYQSGSAKLMLPKTYGEMTEAVMLNTAGGFDSHIHFICPQQIDDALHSGLTTMLGGGTGPAHGTLATTCTPGPWHISRMLQSADSFAMNLAFAGKGNAALPAALEEQIKAGACALKLHEVLELGIEYALFKLAALKTQQVQKWYAFEICR